MVANISMDYVELSVGFMITISTDLMVANIGWTMLSMRKFYV